MFITIKNVMAADVATHAFCETEEEEPLCLRLDLFLE